MTLQDSREVSSISVDDNVTGFFVVIIWKHDIIVLKPEDVVHLYTRTVRYLLLKYHLKSLLAFLHTGGGQGGAPPEAVLPLSETFDPLRFSPKTIE